MASTGIGGFTFCPIKADHRSKRWFVSRLISSLVSHGTLFISRIIFPLPLHLRNAVFKFFPFVVRLQADFLHPSHEGGHPFWIFLECLQEFCRNLSCVTEEFVFVCPEDFGKPFNDNLRRRGFFVVFYPAEIGWGG